MDKKRNYALEERLLQKYFVPQFPDGFLPTMGERIAFKAGMDAAEELYRPLLEAVEKIADPRKRDHKEPDAYTTLGCVMNIANEALESLRKAAIHAPGECKYCNSDPCRCTPGN